MLPKGDGWRAGLKSDWGSTALEDSEPAGFPGEATREHRVPEKEGRCAQLSLTSGTPEDSCRQNQCTSLRTASLGGYGKRCSGVGMHLRRREGAGQGAQALGFGLRGGGDHSLPYSSLLLSQFRRAVFLRPSSPACLGD